MLCRTDSELTARCGQGAYARTANLALWAALDWFCYNGYTLTWEHRPRLSTPELAEADQRSRRARKAMEALL